MGLNVLHLNAQNLIDRTVSARSKFIFIELHFIDNLEIVNSDNDKIEVISENNFGGSSNFILKEEKGTVTIKDVQKFEENNEVRDKDCVVQPVYPSYLIRIPRNKKVKIMITEGNLNVKGYKGDVTIDLERGIARLERLNGRIDLNINVGNVYCRLKNTELNIHTNMGFIRGDKNISVGDKEVKTFKGTIGKPNNKLNINALKANIYIEKYI
jgi:hypothetical protein